MKIGHLSRLQFLGLENNSFAGEIPANISRCTNLEILRLGNNELVGKVLSELSSLPKLQWLSLHYNNLSGSIPPSFGNLSSLDRLSLAGNNFEGNIPVSLSKLKMITYISFGENKLSGTIPPSIFNISSLMFFHVSVNQFQGQLPSDLGFTLPNLKVLNVAKNQFTGPIPSSISNATNLLRLTIPINNFTGKVPSLENLHNLHWVSISFNNLGSGEDGDLSFISSLVNATSLELLAINDNNFGGILPKAVSNFSSQLTIMALDQNQISGSIPAWIENLYNLEILYLGKNQFSGRIPTGIGKLKNLKELLLYSNRFSGKIPSSLGNLTLLTKLSLEKNNLGGSIPQILGNCQDLILMDLSDNNLSGNIPPEIFTGLSTLSIYLDLCHNNLNGSLPIEIGNLRNLAGLDVSDNELSGEIPSTLGSCTSLTQIDMKGNFFQGSIPSSLSSLRGIQVLDLSRNNLSGRIPTYLENFFSLENLNLSFNDFEGQVPTGGVFQNLSAVSVEGNEKLCGGIYGLKLSTCSIEELKKRRSFSAKVVVPIICGIILLTLILAFVILWLRKKRKEPSPESPLLASVLQVSYENLLKATGGFSSDNLIGKGGFGSVYRGVSDQDGTVIAVKVLNLQHQGASKSFMAECEALRNIRHRNLVKILTACASVDFQGNDFKALVYEFMVNGSLEEWLHPTLKTDEDKKKSLNLIQRLNIAIDVASALDYLHHYCQTPIAHCDLKPSNVLLDSEMIGHLGDFGLARFLQEAAPYLSAGQTNSIGINGSIGYAAPEYGMGGDVSKNGDVYSYGILLLEMFTGKRPTESMFKDNLNLHSFAREALPERVADIADPVLLSEIIEGETSTNTTQNQRRTINDIRECLISVFRIGVACSADLPSDRMNISNVAVYLNVIRKNLLEKEAQGDRPNKYTPSKWKN